MIARTVFFVGLIVCVVLGAGCMSTPESSTTRENLTPPEVAERFVQHQDAMTDFSAKVEVTMESWPNRDLFSLEKKSPHHYRMEYLSSGSEANGTLVVTNGSVIWWYSPPTKIVHTTAHFDPDETYLTSMDFQKAIYDLFENHPHAFNLSGIDQVNNSYVVFFSASPEDPFTNLPNDFQNARVWIDAGSWIARRIEFSNASWPSPVTVEYRDIRVNTGIPGREFVFDPRDVPNPPEEFRHHDPVIFLMTLEDAYHTIGPDLVVPEYVPAGYSYEGGYQLADGTVELSLTSGKQWISYIDSPVIGKAYTEPFAGETIEVALNRTLGLFTKGTDKNQLEWIAGGHAYSLTGTVDEDEMIMMAKSLVHVDDQLMKTLPQKGIQLAEPLTVDDLTSLIIPESWIRSHNNSTTPGIIDIRMTAREFSEMFVPDQRYPAFLVYRTTGIHERVALYQVPATMFATNNPNPSEVRLNQPETMFRYYPDLNAVFLDRCKFGQIPCPQEAGG